MGDETGLDCQAVAACGANKRKTASSSKRKGVAYVSGDGGRRDTDPSFLEANGDVMITECLALKPKSSFNLFGPKTVSGELTSS